MAAAATPSTTNTTAAPKKPVKKTPYSAKLQAMLKAAKSPQEKVNIRTRYNDWLGAKRPRGDAWVKQGAGGLVDTNKKLKGVTDPAKQAGIYGNANWIQAGRPKMADWVKMGAGKQWSPGYVKATNAVDRPATLGKFTNRRGTRGPVNGLSVTPEMLQRIAQQRIVDY